MEQLRFSYDSRRVRGLENCLMRDVDVRSAMLVSLRAAHADDSSTRIVEEMGIWSGTVRVDIAVINGELCGVELKSDKDTLGRLPAQAALYNRVFDRVTLVVGQRLHEKAVKIIPAWWGVISASWNGTSVNLTEVRQAHTNPEVDPFLLAQLLWKEEALAVLEEYGLSKGWRSKPAAAIHRHLADGLTSQQLGLAVRSALKQRPFRSR
jgi:hypothetical protein